MAIPLGLSKDGYEMQFAVNHLTHALIVKLCLGALGRSEDGRIVVLTSLGFKSPPKGGIRFGELRSEMGNLGTFTFKPVLSTLEVPVFEIFRLEVD